MQLLVDALTALFIFYAMLVVVFIILDNRSPQSTFAWLLLFIFFPIGGFIIYFFFGREIKAFSRTQQEAGEEIYRDLEEVLSPLLARQDSILEEIRRYQSIAAYRKLLELSRRNVLSALTTRNRVEVLQNAQQKYPRLLEDLRQAQHSIHLAYYIWASDPFTEQVKEILLERAGAGVEVRMMYDAVGTGSALSSQYIRELKAGGVEVYPFSPKYKLHTLGYRNHRKIAVIDGRIGYTGGMNIGQEHLDGGKYFDCWRDTHLRVEGEAALVLQAVFATSWYTATAQKLLDPAYFPLETDVDHFLPVQVVASGPDTEWRAIRHLYFLMITSAAERIYIQSPFFIPDDSISEALKSAALAGVEVKVMCAPRGSTYNVPYWAANTYFKEMARAGVRVFLYQRGYFHPKTIVIDGRICSIGSANMDIRSFSINYETNAVIYDEKIAGQIEQAFQHDLQYCTEFTLEAYEQKPVLARLRDSVCRLFSPLL